MRKTDKCPAAALRRCWDTLMTAIVWLRGPIRFAGANTA